MSKMLEVNTYRKVVVSSKLVTHQQPLDVINQFKNDSSKKNCPFYPSFVCILTRISVYLSSSSFLFRLRDECTAIPHSLQSHLIRRTLCCWHISIQFFESINNANPSKTSNPGSRQFATQLIPYRWSYRGSSTQWPQAFQRSYYMALKPQRLHQIEETSLLTSGKKPRKMTTVSAMKDSFEKYAEYLNEFNDKRERVVKASRDITINSKKVIFQVHRISKLNRDEVLEKAEKDLAFVTSQYMSRLVKELQGTDFWKLRRAYSPGVQEYIEAATLCKFCKSGTLLDLAEINASLLPLGDPSLEPLQINVLDYLLGVADLTGELMRLAIGRISDGELEYARTICWFARDIYRELTLVVPYMDENAEMKKKMEVMLQSVVKIENACLGVHVRGSEYIPSLGAGDQSYSFFGVPDSIEL